MKVALARLAESERLRSELWKVEAERVLTIPLTRICISVPLSFAGAWVEALAASCATVEQMVPSSHQHRSLVDKA